MPEMPESDRQFSKSHFSYNPFIVTPAKSPNGIPIIKEIKVPKRRSQHQYELPKYIGKNVHAGLIGSKTNDTRRVAPCVHLPHLSFRDQMD